MKPNDEGEASDDNSNRDRISQLPDPILHTILSLALNQMLDLIRLSHLSTRWNQVWRTMPCLNFDSHGFTQRADQDLMNVERFTEFINFVLNGQGDSRIISFRLHLDDVEDRFDGDQISRWLDVVARRGVQELVIKFAPEADEFMLPISVATSESLQVLKLNLEDFTMELPSTPVRWNQMKSLYLERIEFPDSDTVQRLFSASPVLESFQTDLCTPNRRFTLLDFSSECLRELIIGFDNGADGNLVNCEIRVSCPNLRLFKCSAPVAKEYVIENKYALESVTLDVNEAGRYDRGKVGEKMYNQILKKLPNMMDLSLETDLIRCFAYIINQVRCSPITFHRLRRLSVTLLVKSSNTKVLFLLLGRCPNLEALTLTFSHRLLFGWDESEEWELEGNEERVVNWKAHPRMKTMQIDEFRGEKNELQFLYYFLENASGLEELNITLVARRHAYYDPDETALMVLAIPTASQHLTITFLQSHQ